MRKKAPLRFWRECHLKNFHLVDLGEENKRGEVLEREGNKKGKM